MDRDVNLRIKKKKRNEDCSNTVYFASRPGWAIPSWSRVNSIVYESEAGKAIQ